MRLELLFSGTFLGVQLFTCVEISGSQHVRDVVCVDGKVCHALIACPHPLHVVKGLGSLCDPVTDMTDPQIKMTDNRVFSVPDCDAGA